MAKKYSELLRDPRWQKVRLQIMSRDEWKCRFCGTFDQTLIVHHDYYTCQFMPWEYPQESLLTLCEACHELTHGHNLPLHELKSYLMERHAFGTLTDDGVAYFFDKNPALAGL